MTTFGTKEHYGWVAQLFHWLTAILVLLAFLLGPGGPEARVYLPERDAARILHESLGMAVLGLVLLRLVWRVFDRAPEEPPMPVWMALMAAAAHWALYGLLFAVPLSAICGAWAEGHGLNIYLFGEIAPPFGPSHDLGVIVSGLHKYLGDAIMWLAGLHAAAGIGHHLLLRDRVLVSMLPLWLPLWRK